MVGILRVKIRIEQTLRVLGKRKVQPSKDTKWLNCLSMKLNNFYGVWRCYLDAYRYAMNFCGWINVMGTTTLKNARFEYLISKARYEFEGVVVEGRSVLARFHRNAAGLRGLWLGLTGQKLYLLLDKRSCFELAKSFKAVMPRLLAYSDNAYAFKFGGASIQEEKLKSGIILDCPDSWIRNP